MKEHKELVGSLMVANDLERVVELFIYQNVRHHPRLGISRGIKVVVDGEGNHFNRIDDNTFEELHSGEVYHRV